MLTVLTNESTYQHERIGVASRNKPELRQKVIMDLIQKTFPNCKIIISSKLISKEWLSNIHDKDYINFLENAFDDCQKVIDLDWIDLTNGLVPNHFYKKKPHKGIPIYKLSGFYGTDCMTPIHNSTYQNAMISAQQAYSAAEFSCDNDHNNITYVLACSPGHHAKYAEYGGYCFINNATVAAYRLLELGKSKVGILDVDFHSGQGTAALVNENSKFKNTLFACSIHAHPFVEYPSFEGYEDDYDNAQIKNIPLQPHAGWKEYSEALEIACMFLKQQAIESLIIAFGADTFKNDPDASELSRFTLDLDNYDQMGNVIRSHFETTQIIVTQEGGYDLDNVPQIVYRFLNGLMK